MKSSSLPSSISHPSHPFWKILRIAVVGGVLLASLSLFYERLDSRDLYTILTVAAGLAGYDISKAKLTKESSQKEEQE